jgi:hypothetical protein
MTRILAAHPLGPENIAEIVAQITPFEMGHIGTIGPEPHDITGAQLSVHFALGLTVAKRSNDFNAYIDAMNSGFKDPGVLAAARKVSVVEIPEPKDGDFLQAGSLTVKTNDGKTYEERLQPSKGSPQNPMTPSPRNRHKLSGSRCAIRSNQLPLLPRKSDSCRYPCTAAVTEY